MRVQESRIRSWRRILLATAVFAGGVITGLGFAAQTAAAATPRFDSWTCFGTDECHAGTRTCCETSPDGHCTTQCPVCSGAGCPT
jgi:hypothetical protein